MLSIELETLFRERGSIILIYLYIWRAMVYRAPKRQQIYGLSFQGLNIRQADIFKILIKVSSSMSDL